MYYSSCEQNSRKVIEDITRRREWKSTINELIAKAEGISAYQEEISKNHGDSKGYRSQRDSLIGGAQHFENHSSITFQPVQRSELYPKALTDASEKKNSNFELYIRPSLFFLQEKLHGPH